MRVVLFGTIRTVGLFIGAIVGAGLATGRETIVFFNGGGSLNVVIAGALMGAACALFMYVGREKARLVKFVRVHRAVNVVVVACTVVSFVVMVSGAEELLYAIFGLKKTGLLLGLITAFLSSRTIRSIEKINAALVPMIIALITWIAVSCGADPVGGKFSVIDPIGYVGMNMLLGGYLIAERGERPSNNEIALTSTVVGLMCTLILSLVYSLAVKYPDAAMPMIECAREAGVITVGGIIVLAAIFTTMLGAGKAAYDCSYRLTRSKCASISVIALLAIISYEWEFKKVVDRFYPAQGAIGGLYMCAAVAAAAYAYCKRSELNKKNRALVRVRRHM